MDLYASKCLLLLLAFIGCCDAQDILPEGPLEAILGKNVTIKTLVDKPVYAFIIWNFSDGTDQIHVATVSTSGLKVNEPYEGRVSIDPVSGSLTIRAVTSEDSGDFSINIISTDGATKTSEIKLRVLEPVSNVAIKSNLPQAIEHNSTVVLTCSAKGSFLKFTWLNGTTPIVADGKRLSLKEEELSSALTITGVLRSDLVGPIYCTAANKLETEKSAAFNLTVFYGPEAVAISPAAPPAFIKSASAFNLSCSATSNPPATFVWYHNKKQMEAGGAVLTLKAIEAQIKGKAPGDYMCVAKNAKTERVVPSAGVTFTVLDPVVGIKIAGPAAVLIAGNSSANISCQASSGVVKGVAWLKDGQPLAGGGRVTFAADMSSVMIKPLQKEDNGQFTCQLSNPVSTVEASYNMVVNYGPDAASVAGNIAVEVNDPVTLECSAASVPVANFTWKYNGTMTAVKTAKYVIEKAVYKNTGTYTCEAHNPVTKKTAMSTHTLSVKEEGALDPTLSDGAIAGIVIAVIAALAIAIGLVIYCRQKVPVESPY